MNLNARNRVCALVMTLTLPLLAPVASNASDAIELPVLDCVVEPNLVVDVSSSAEGVLSIVHVNRSDRVEAGQVLARLEAEVETANVALARARSEINTDIHLSQTKLGLDRRNRERMLSLFEKSAVALTLKDEASTEAELSSLRLTKAREQQHLAELELARALGVLNRRTVRSPISGVVVERYKHPGEYVENEPIVQVATLDPLRVEVVAPFELFGSIHAGMVGEITPELGAFGTRTARVTVVDEIMDAASGTFGIRLELPNPNHELPGGLRCQVRFTDEPSTPRNAPSPSQTAATTQSHDGDRGHHASAQPTSTTGTPVCRTIGPINTRDSAERIATALTSENVSVTRREETEAVIEGYLILAQVPKDSTPEHFAAQLSEHGVTDLVALETGAYQSAFSLGYYETKSGALARLATLDQAGISADLRPQISPLTKHWLNLNLRDEQWSELSLIEQVRDLDPDAEPKLALCEQLVANEF